MEYMWCECDTRGINAFGETGETAFYESTLGPP